MTQPYLDLLHRIVKTGHDKHDRTGVGTRSVFGEQIRFDLTQGFPLLTTKKLPFRWVAEELFWMLRGSTNEHELREKGVDIWKEWATKEQCERFGREEGDLGPVYGKQFRNFGGVRTPSLHIEGVDQIAVALNTLASNPGSRRVIVTGWNPKEASAVALPPCHTLFQFETHQAPRQFPGMRPTTICALSCHMYMRSADVFLGVPFNIASYALLTHMFAYVLGYHVQDLIVSFGDVHVYRNHFEQVEEQLSREPRELPRLNIESPTLPNEKPETMYLGRLLSIRFKDLKLEGYNPHPKIAAEVAV